MSPISHDPGSSCIRFAGRPHLAINLAALVGLVFAAIPSPAQTPLRPALGAHTAPAKRQAFEVASIRMDDPNSKVDHNTPNDAPNQEPTFPANRWTMRYMMMISLICTAYSDIDCGHVEGAPHNNVHYNIMAKVEGNAMLTKDQMRPMLRTLLEDRFHLKVHIEHRLVPGYALVLAKGGSKLKVHVDSPPNAFFGGSRFRFQNVSAEYLAQAIGWVVKQPVVDKTGLTGMYDAQLESAPQDGKDNPRFANLPSVFTAVQEQLGLKLRPEKVPGNYLVIDHVDRIPTEN